MKRLSPLSEPSLSANGLAGLAAVLLATVFYIMRGLPEGFVTGHASFWLMQTQDITQYVSGFMAFFQDSWRWPLLRIDSINWPEGTLATFVDAIPLYALILKLVVPSSVGPFNPYGAWIAVCLLLQGIGGWWALREAGINRWSALVALTGLLLTTPVLQHRLGHVSLFSQWILVFALALTLRSQRLGFTSAGWCALMICALYINIYLTAMAALLYVADLWQHRALPNLRRWLLWPLLAIGLAMLTMPLLMWPLPGHHLARDGGFGLYSMNLLSPLTGSRFFSFSKPFMNEAQAVEGFNYLGAGVLVMLGWLWITRSRFAGVKPILTNPVPMIMALVVATVYALSNRISLGDNLLLEWVVPGRADALTGQFRASGRFFWLVVYTASIFGVIALARRFNGWQLVTVLGLVLGLQLADRYPALLTLRALAAPPDAFKLSQYEWGEALGKDTDTIYFYPKMRCAKNSSLYDTLLPVMRYAAQRHINLTTGYIARYAPDCAAMAQEAQNSRPANSAYVFVNSEYTEDEIASYLPKSASWRCRQVDFATVCTPSKEISR